jgi:hypothetical protein
MRSFKQRNKPRLLEVSVFGQGLSDPQGSHDTKTATICEGPRFASALEEKSPGGVKPIGVRPFDATCLGGHYDVEEIMQLVRVTAGL